MEIVYFVVYGHVCHICRFTHVFIILGLRLLVVHSPQLYINNSANTLKWHIFCDVVEYIAIFTSMNILPKSFAFVKLAESHKQTFSRKWFTSDMNHLTIWIPMSALYDLPEHIIMVASILIGHKSEQYP